MRSNHWTNGIQHWVWTGFFHMCGWSQSYAWGSSNQNYKATCMPFSAYEHLRCSLSGFLLLVLHSYSQINQGLIHFIWPTRVAHQCTLSFTESLIWIYFKTPLNHNYMQTFLFLWVSFTQHTTLWMSITRGRSVVSEETPLTEYTIAHMPSLHKFVICFHWASCQSVSAFTYGPIQNQWCISIGKWLLFYHIFILLRN